MAKLEWRNRMEPKTIPGLLGRALLLLVLPYLYLLLCGLVFDMLLRWYFMVDFIFYSLIALYLAALGLIVWMVIRYVKSGKKGG